MLFYNTEKNLSTTNNEILEHYPSLLKELVNRKYWYKLQGNCTKPNK